MGAGRLRLWVLSVLSAVVLNCGASGPPWGTLGVQCELAITQCLEEGAVMTETGKLLPHCVRVATETVRRRYDTCTDREANAQWACNALCTNPSIGQTSCTATLVATTEEAPTCTPFEEQRTASCTATFRTCPPTAFIFPAGNPDVIENPDGIGCVAISPNMEVSDTICFQNTTAVQTCRSLCNGHDREFSNCTIVTNEVVESGCVALAPPASETATVGLVGTPFTPGTLLAQRLRGTATLQASSTAGTNSQTVDIVGGKMIVLPTGPNAFLFDTLSVTLGDFTAGGGLAFSVQAMQILSQSPFEVMTEGSGFAVGEPLPPMYVTASRADAISATSVIPDSLFGTIDLTSGTVTMAGQIVQNLVGAGPAGSDVLLTTTLQFEAILRRDLDGDGVPDEADNCPAIANPGQTSAPGPVVVAPPPVQISSCNNPNIGQATAQDVCGTGGVVVSKNAPSKFPLGTTTVTWIATDARGNVATATQLVTAVLGDDTSCCPVGTHVIVGTSNNDTLNGTSGSDCILGRGAQDTINGLGGNDFIGGGEGNDVINGGDGNDTIFGAGGQDQVNGGNGIDVLDGGNGDDVCRGGSGADTLRGGDGQDQLFGEADNDSLFGDNGDDRLDGGLGNDLLNGGGLHDICIGGGGTNTFVACESQL